MLARHGAVVDGFGHALHPHVGGGLIDRKRQMACAQTRVATPWAVQRRAAPEFTLEGELLLLGFAQFWREKRGDGTTADAGVKVLQQRPEYRVSAKGCPITDLVVHDARR